MKELQKMSETEKMIMELVWQSEPPVTASEIQQAASQVKLWKQTTVATFLQNLAQKGLLRVVKKGHTNLYYPQLTKEEYLQFETMEFLQTVHHGSLKSFVSALCGNKKSLDAAQIAELRKLWEES